MSEYNRLVAVNNDLDLPPGVVDRLSKNGAVKKLIDEKNTEAKSYTDQSVNASLADSKGYTDSKTTALKTEVTAYSDQQVSSLSQSIDEKLSKFSVGLPIFATKSEARAYKDRLGKQALFLSSEYDVVKNDFIAAWSSEKGVGSSTWTDLSERYTLSLDNGTLTKRDGVYLDGSTKLSTRDLSSIKSDTITVVLFIKTLSNPTNGRLLFKTQDNYNGPVLFSPALGVAPTDPKSIFVDVWSSSDPAPLTSENVNKWQMVAYRCSGKSVAVYGGGQFFTPKDVSKIANASVGISTLEIGARANNGFYGEIKEIQVYNRFLPDLEIEELSKELTRKYGA